MELKGSVPCSQEPAYSTKNIQQLNCKMSQYVLCEWKCMQILLFKSSLAEYTDAHM